MSNATHNVLLTSTSAISTAYAIALLAAPGATLKLFGLDDAVAAVWITRILGSALLGVATLAFFARRVGDLEARRAIDAGFLVFTTGGLAITMWAQYLQVMNALGWVNAAMYGILAVAFFYFLSAEDRTPAFDGHPA